ncbi:MAG: glycosyltransferase [Anaerolineales bacterium]|nr:glycosyltransferase [Anaerolineales bacterium]
MKPLVSIITPSYNQAQYLEDTIQSVLQQDYPNLEYIIVDGGSTDGSPEVIEKYQDNFAWWVSEPDQGQADAINKGFKKANGEIIAWLNSDDLYLPGAISSAVDLFQKYPNSGVIYGDAVSADADGRLLNELRFSNWGTRDFLQFNIICQPAVFMKRSIVEKVGYLDPTYHFFLDHQLWIRLSRETEFVHHPETWAVSRYHPEAKNVTMASECGAEVIRIMDWAEKEPDLAAIIGKNYHQVWAGAYQMIARYLLDGGKPGEAFRTYYKAARTWPPSLRTYWHRFLFSALDSLGLGFIGKWYYNLKNRRPPDIFSKETLENWPGLQLH